MRTLIQTLESFYKYIPNDLDKGEIMQKLHSIVDGKSGVNVIKVLRSAIVAEVIAHCPAEESQEGLPYGNDSWAEFFRKPCSCFDVSKELSQYL